MKTWSELVQLTDAALRVCTDEGLKQEQRDCLADPARTDEARQMLEHMQARIGVPGRVLDLWEQFWAEPINEARRINALIDRARHAAIFWTRAGFEEIGTGGGCTAYSKSRADGSYVLITEPEDANVPRGPEVCLGYYNVEAENVVGPDGNDSFVGRQEEALRLARRFLGEG